MNKKDFNKYVFILFIIILGVIAFFIAKPFINDMLSALVIAYIFYPLYKKIYSKVGYKFLSALLIILLIFFVIVIPLIWLGSSFYSEIRSFVLLNEEFSEFLGEQDIEYSQILTMKQLGNLMVDRTDLFSKVYEFFDIISTISNTIIHFFIMLFMTFFFIKDGDKLSKFLKETFEFKGGLNIAHTLQITINAVIYGIVIVALIQGIVALIGYGVLSVLGGIKNPVLWGILTALAAFIPTVGTGLIWLPMSLFLIFKGIFLDQLPFVFMGIGLLIYGSIFIGTIDNFIRPKLIGDRADIHPVVVLVGVLGGVAIFGIMGIIIGPVIFALAQEIIILYKNNELI